MNLFVYFSVVYLLVTNPGQYKLDNNQYKLDGDQYKTKATPRIPQGGCPNPSGCHRLTRRTLKSR